MRGNVDTRLRKVEAGEVEAVVLARAGLARIGRLDAVTEVIDPLQMLPAPGQGALAVECRASDDALAAMLAAALDDLGSRAAVAAERAFLAAVEAGCTAPVGALADVAEDELYLRGVIASLDGEEVFRQSMTGAVSRPGGDRPPARPGNVRVRSRRCAGVSVFRGFAYVDGRATTVTDIPQPSSDSPAAPGGRGRGAGAERGTPARSPRTGPRARVVLLGRGPGDAALLTVRGRDLLARADVVVVDPGRAPAAAAWPPEPLSAEVVEAPGQAAETAHACAQRAAGGALVVRVFPGDPLVGGRGAAEATQLAAEGVPFEIVPGCRWRRAWPPTPGFRLAAPFCVATLTSDGDADPDWADAGRHHWAILGAPRRRCC